MSITLGSPPGSGGGSGGSGGGGLSGLDPKSVVFVGENGKEDTDSSEFVWDKETNSLGIGTTTPSGAVQITDNNIDLFRAENETFTSILGQTVRRGIEIKPPLKAGVPENAAIHMRLGDREAPDQTFQNGLYIELANQPGTIDGVTAIKILHQNSRDAIFVRVDNENAIGYEAALNQPATRGYISTLQPYAGSWPVGFITPHDDAGLSLSVTPYQALWDAEPPTVVPTNGLYHCQKSTGRSFVTDFKAGRRDEVPNFLQKEEDGRIRFQVLNSGRLDLWSLEATSSGTTKSAPDIQLRGEYWDGSESQDARIVLRNVVTTSGVGTGDPEFRVVFVDQGSEDIGYVFKKDTLDFQGHSITGLGSIAAAAETPLHLDLQNGDISGVGDIGGVDNITFGVGVSGTLDLSGGDITGVGTLTAQAAEPLNLDLQNGNLAGVGDITGVDNLTFVAGGAGALNMSTGDITNAALIQLQAGGSASFNAQAGRLRALGNGTSGDRSISFASGDTDTGIWHPDSGELSIGTQGNDQVKMADNGLGFYGATPINKPTISGSRGNPEEALANLLSQLEALGLIVDNTTS